jgi:hypothetical protein
VRAGRLTGRSKAKALWTDVAVSKAAKTDSSFRLMNDFMGLSPYADWLICKYSLMLIQV